MQAEREAMEKPHEEVEEEQKSTDDSSHRRPPLTLFLEVACRSSGKFRRFAAGTTARYALHTINRKLELGAPAALHIEAIKDGEEPVSFGPTAILANYGQHWKLQTITEQDVPEIHQTLFPDTKQGEDKLVKNPLESETITSTSIYIAKIILAFVFIFLLGGLFTFFLEKLPDMIQLISAPIFVVYRLII